MKKEQYLSLAIFLFILTLLDICVMKYMIYHFEMNGERFVQVGMMSYTNPQDHRELYIPIFEKVITK